MERLAIMRFKYLSPHIPLDGVEGEGVVGVADSTEFLDSERFTGSDDSGAVVGNLDE